MSLTFIQSILYECHVPKTDCTEQNVLKTGRIQDKMHLFMCDCDF